MIFRFKNPGYYVWHDWFAWYPVVFKDYDEKGDPISVFAWLVTVQRYKKVSSTDYLLKRP